jgi:hypothetical protein
MVLSFFAVFFISNPNGESSNSKNLLLPIIVFLGSGAIDTLLNYVEQSFIPAFEAAHIITTVFFYGIFGWC